jgi:hypothetical protein
VLRTKTSAAASDGCAATSRRRFLHPDPSLDVGFPVVSHLQYFAHNQGFGRVLCMVTAPSAQAVGLDDKLICCAITGAVVAAGVRLMAEQRHRG